MRLKFAKNTHKPTHTINILNDFILQFYKGFKYPKNVQNAPSLGFIAALKVQPTMAIAISWIDARAFEGNNFQEGTTFVTNCNLFDLKFHKQ